MTTVHSCCSSACQRCACCKMWSLPRGRIAGRRCSRCPRHFSVLCAVCCVCSDWHLLKAEGDCGDGSFESFPVRHEHRFATGTHSYWHVRGRSKVVKPVRQPAMDGTCGAHTHLLAATHCSVPPAHGERQMAYCWAQLGGYTVYGVAEYMRFTLVRHPSGEELRRTNSAPASTLRHKLHAGGADGLGAAEAEWPWQPSDQNGGTERGDLLRLHVPSTCHACTSYVHAPRMYSHLRLNRCARAHARSVNRNAYVHARTHARTHSVCARPHTCAGTHAYVCTCERARFVRVNSRSAALTARCGMSGRAAAQQRWSCRSLSTVHRPSPSALHCRLA